MKLEEMIYNLCTASLLIKTIIIIIVIIIIINNYKDPFPPHRPPHPVRRNVH